MVRNETFSFPRLCWALFFAFEYNRAGLPPPGELQQYRSQIGSF